MAAKMNNITVALTQLRVGLIIPADVFNARNGGPLLIRNRVPVTESLLVKLRSRGVQYVMIDETAAGPDAWISKQLSKQRWQLREFSSNLDCSG